MLLNITLKLIIFRKATCYPLSTLACYQDSFFLQINLISSSSIFPINLFSCPSTSPYFSTSIIINLLSFLPFGLTFLSGLFLSSYQSPLISIHVTFFTNFLVYQTLSLINLLSSLSSFNDTKIISSILI